ncbi:hypothetical protein HMI55_005049 [Coelomomyces lativittatus]|nr:hypothetical protein HMI55_005049 [Coelomomyces lativittatus]
MNDGSSNHKPKVYNLRTRPTSSISTKNNASNVQNETISSPPQEKTSSNSSKSNTTASNQKKILSKQVPENTLDPLISLKVSDPEKKNISHPIKMNPEVNGKVSLTSTSSIFEKKNTTPQSSLNILSNEVNPEVSESTLSIAKGRRKSRRSINSAEVTELTKENPKFPSNAFEKNHVLHL